MRGLLIVLPAALLTGLMLLSGCGQKGPLYLPQDPSNNAPMAEQPSQATAEQEKKNPSSNSSNP